MHFGKKYAKNTGRQGGKKHHSLNIVKTAFEIIHLKTGKNPVEILVRAVENSAPNEDTTRIVYGGTVYHVSVDVAPLRRVDLALRFIADAIKEATFSNPKAIEPKRIAPAIEVKIMSGIVIKLNSTDSKNTG